MAKKSKTKTKAKAKSKTKKSAVKAKARKTARPKASRPKAAPKRKTAARKKSASKSVVRKIAPAGRPEVPQGYSSVTAYLVAENAAAALDYYKAVFGAREEMRFALPGGKIGHAEFRIGDTKLMIADEHPDHHAFGPRHFNGSPVTLTLYVKDVDTTVALAVRKGAKLLRPVQDQFYGDRSGSIEDPAGHVWHVMTHVEDVSAAEVNRRMKAMMKEEQPPQAVAEAALNAVTEPA
jgi:PhnB protein